MEQTPSFFTLIAPTTDHTTELFEALCSLLKEHDYSPGVRYSVSRQFIKRHVSPAVFKRDFSSKSDTDYSAIIINGFIPCDIRTEICKILNS